MCVCLDMLYGVKTKLYRYDELRERERERECVQICYMARKHPRDCRNNLRTHVHVDIEIHAQDVESLKSFRLSK